VSRADIEAKNYDLKAVNPNRRRKVDTRTPAEILAEIERLGQEADAAIAELRRLIQ
jgi:type I restriction enzyme M protein